MAKRIVSGVIGLVILLTVFALNNMLVLNVAVTIIALLGISEFYNAFKSKNINPIEIVGYLSALPILGISYVEPEILKMLVFFMLPIAIFLLFFKSIKSNLKYNIIDISVTIMGIVYIPLMLSFIPLICDMKYGGYLVWYMLAAAWLTDTCAYFVGSAIGKHKFSEISPKKSVEGCIGGAIGSMAFFGLYSYCLTRIGIDLNVPFMTLFGFIISFVSQLGDFAASSIKRYCDIKDFGNIMPGHGGALDRFDSIIMIAPFMYMIFQFIV